MMRRREFVRVLLSGTLLAASGLPLSAAAPARTLVLLFLRGGVDALHFAVPYSDPAYRRHRRRLAVRPSPALRLDDRFALHPALSDLLPLYRSGSLGLLVNVGTPEHSRSHFAAADYVESGGLGVDRGGWLNRLLARGGPDVLRGVVAGSHMPLAMRGAFPVVSLSDLGKLSIGPQDRDGALLEAYRSSFERSSSPLLASGGRSTFEALDRIQKLDPASYRPAATYPATDLGRALRLIAFLVKRSAGVAVAYAELNGWDTHAKQGADDGVMAGLMRDLAGSLSAFWKDLGTHREAVVLQTVTEFGRRVAENGSRGTDHGHGSCMLALGTRVRGGRVHGRWQGLEASALFEGIDLPVTTDYRDVWLEALSFLGHHSPRQLFPGYAPGPPPGLLSHT